MYVYVEGRGVLRTRGGGCGQSKATVEEAAKEGTKADAAAPRARLSAAALARAEERYALHGDLSSHSSSLCALLTHDRARGGVPIKLLSARWLLEYFQAEDHAFCGWSTGRRSSAHTARCHLWAARRSSACCES